MFEIFVRNLRKYLRLSLGCNCINCILGPCTHKTKCRKNTQLIRMIRSWSSIFFFLVIFPCGLSEAILYCKKRSHVEDWKYRVFFVKKRTGTEKTIYQSTFNNK